MPGDLDKAKQLGQAAKMAVKQDDTSKAQKEAKSGSADGSGSGSAQVPKKELPAKGGDQAAKDQKSAKALDDAGKTGDKLNKLDSASKVMDGKEGQLAGQAIQNGIQGDGESGARNVAGRYAGSAASGAIGGAKEGGVHGAAIGAIKGVAVEGGKDAVKGASKVTGGTADAKAYDKRDPKSKDDDKGIEEGNAGGTNGSSKDDSGGGAAGKAALVGGAAAAPPAGGMITLMAILNWMKTLFMQAAAAALNGLQALAGMAIAFVKSVGNAIMAPVTAVGNVVGGLIGAVTGITVAGAGAVATGGISMAAVLGMLAALFTGVTDVGGAADDHGVATDAVSCSVESGYGGGGGGTFDGEGVPAESIPWINNASSHSKEGIPPAFFAFIMQQETTFQPDDYADDANGGTQGLFQINHEEWSKVTDGGSWDSPDITDPMVHTEYGAKYFDARLKTVRGYREAHPDEPFAKDLTELEALMIAHNAGEGGMMKYPDIPKITKGYLSNFREDFEKFGGDSDQINSGAVGSVGTGVSDTSSGCDDSDNTGGLSSGGLTKDEADKMMKTYNSDADDVLGKSPYSPAKCSEDGSYVRNCVSFSWYFIDKYTTYDKGYAPGNGKDVAGNIASKLGKETSETPKPYSIFSHANSSSAGHTGVVLAVDGDRILIGEAAYCGFEGRARWVDASEWKDKGWSFADVSDLVGDKGADPGDVSDLDPGDKTGNKVVDAALSQAGNPYVWGGGGTDGPGKGNRPEDKGEVGYDCSGLVQYAYAKKGKDLPHYSADQQNAGKKVSQSEAKPGDIVGWPGHVGIYAGHGKVIHASHSKNKVIKSNLWGSPTFTHVDS